MRHPFIRFVTTVCSRRFPVLGIGLLLASLLAPAFAQESCGTDPATSPNHSSHYILGETDGVASAMHWSTGLVWQRCTQGTSGADCTVGSYESRIWNDWMDQYTPRSFAGQEDWWDGGATGPLGFDRLQDGSWRLAYLKELDYLHSGCLVAPSVNWTVFPNSSEDAAWSASPSRDNANAGWAMYFNGDGHKGPYQGLRSDHWHTRLVRGGQSFENLGSTASRTEPEGSLVIFDPITLGAPGGTTAWGGARIAGAGNPEFSRDGGTTWVSEAIVKSGDVITVRMTAGAGGSTGSATFTLHSGQTTGTPDGSSPFPPPDGSCPLCGEEDTTLAETTATFTVTAIKVYTLNYTAGPGGTLTGAVSQSVTEGEDGTEVIAVPDAHYHFIDWDDGVAAVARTDTDVHADLDVTARFAIDTWTVTFVDWDGSVLDTRTVDHGSAATAPAHPIRAGYTFTGWDVPFNNVTSDLTVTAQYAIDSYTVIASVLGGHGGVLPASQTVNHGGFVTFTLTPDAGYHAVMPAGGDCPAGSLSGDQYVTGAITADCTVTVSFEQNPADGLTVQGGDGQDVPVLDGFPVALSVRVADAGDMPLEGITVNFAAPASGASAVLSASSAVTDASGIASVTATANEIAGSYEVEASVGGSVPPPAPIAPGGNGIMAAAPVVFALSNTALASSLDLAISPTTVAPGQTATLTATVTGGGSLVPGGTVDFLVDGAIVCADVPVDASGMATCSAGPFSPGLHQAEAWYSGDASHDPVSGNLPLAFAAGAPISVPGNHPLVLLMLLLGVMILGGAVIQRKA